MPIMNQDHSKCQASPQEQDNTFLSNGLRKGCEKVVCLCGAETGRRHRLALPVRSLENL